MIHQPTGADGSAERPDVEAPAWEIDRAHEEKATGSLRAEPEFFSVLQREFPKFFRADDVPQTEAGMAQFFAQAEVVRVQSFFRLVCRCLSELNKKNLSSATRKRIIVAGADLYCLAACRLVDQAVHRALASQRGGDQYVVHVPTEENIVCGIIATALFGGELRLPPPGENEMPRAEWVLETDAPGGEQTHADFEIAAYNAVFHGAEGETKSSLDCGSGLSLTSDQRLRLMKRIDNIRNVEFCSLALLVKGLASSDRLSFGCAIPEFTEVYKVPVLVPETAATARLLGMDPSELRANIWGFWNYVRGWPASRKAADQPPLLPREGESAMPATGRETHFHGPIHGPVSIGDYSPSQAGTGHTANVARQQGFDPIQLIKLLQQLAEETKEVASAETRDAMTAHVELALHEADKKERADPGRIKRALDVVKSSAEGLEQGGKIISLCNKTYNVVAPYLNLPPSPLP